jgi:protein TonB
MRLLVIALAVFFTFDLLAQDSTRSKPFTIVEQMPEYPGGDIALFKFIEEHLHYPDTIISGNTRVVVGFTVNEDGSLSDISVKKSADPALDTEALRVMSLIPYHFKPGIQNGKSVRVKFVLPFDFKKKR